MLERAVEHLLSEFGVAVQPPHRLAQAEALLEAEPNGVVEVRPGLEGHAELARRQGLANGFRRRPGQR